MWWPCSLRASPKERRQAMPSRPQTLKIRPEHLSRNAVIYVRQSTLLQVRENIGSTTRQYDLVKRAQELGWEPAGIQVIDQDQGQSGASSIGRDGLQRNDERGRTALAASATARRQVDQSGTWTLAFSPAQRPGL